MKLIEALDIKPGEVISLVGGGGKTTLMFALAQELTSSGNHVITTTTTKIFKPSSAETPLILLETDEEKILNAIQQNVERYGHITIARELLPSGKLSGINPELVVKIAQLNPISCIIVEADGAAGKSLKAPNLTEPVVPENTSLVIPVVGIDAIGRRLTAEHVFRADIAAKLSGLPSGEVVSAEAIALLLTHPQGLIKGSPAQARIIPFLNKVDLDDGLLKGRDLAGKILVRGHPQIERVILGHAKLPEPAVEVIAKATNN